MKSIFLRYLPKEIVDKIEKRTLSEKERRDIIHKYNNILRIISTYIPQHLVYTKLTNPDDTKHEGRFIEGTVLFADVSGFTAMTEKLSRYGNEGSEEITKILNAFFTAMVELILRYKGSLLKYGGDAMMILFSSEEEFCGKDHALYAASCASFMQEKMEKEFKNVHSKFGDFPLKLTMSFHSDTYFESCVGDKKAHVEYFLSGKGVELTALMESFALDNQILTDDRTLSLIKERVKKTSKKENYNIIESFDRLNMPAVTEAIVSIDYDELEELLTNLEVLLPYVTKGVYEKVKNNWQSLSIEGEHRPVSVLFLNYYFSEDIFSSSLLEYQKEIQNVLSEYFLMIQNIVEELDGTINKIDMYHHGNKIIIIFGFPRVHSDDEGRAIKSAMAILDNGKRFVDKKIGGLTFSIHQKIGIHAGFIYSGNVGSPLRKEYTIMGDAVNLSARIMSMCKEDEVWISDFIYNKAKEICAIEKTENKEFKGKTGVTLVHKLGGVLREERKFQDFFIGREGELALLKKLYSQSSQRLSAVQIVGSVGVGKTHLSREFIREIKDRHEVIIGRGIPYGADVQYNPIKEILIFFFGILRSDSDERIKEKIDMYVSHLGLEDISYTIPLIGALLCKAYEDYPVMSIEDPIEKKELLHNAFFRLIEARSRLNNVVILLEDSEWIDEGSLDLINSILLKPLKNVFLIVATRAELSFTSGMELINLDVFDKKETFSFIDRYPSDKPISDKTKEEIYERSKGVPYFIYEILNSIRNMGDNVKLPDSIYKSVLSRMDLLDEKAKDVLKCASVLGVEFSLDMLGAVFNDEKNLEKILPKLVEEDFLIAQSSNMMIFRNMMVREVAYNSISVKKKKEIHSKVAHLFESYKDTSVNLEKTAFHYESSENYEKALYFYESSGVAACKLNNYNKALDYFLKARELLAKVGDSAEIKKSKINIHKKVGRIYFILKKYEDAYNSYEIAYQTAVNTGCETEAADCLLNSGIINLHMYDYKKALDYFYRAMPIFEKHSDLNSLGSCYLNIGLIDRVTGKASEALSNYKKALSNYQEAKNLKGCADAYNNLGNLSKNTTGYNDSLEYYKKALEMYESLKDVSGIAAANNNIGALKSYNGDYKEAVKSYELSLAIENSVGNEKGKAECFSNLGNAYIMLNDYNKADEYYKKAHEIAYTINDSLSIGEIALNRAVLCIYQNQFPLAKELLKSSSGIFTSLGYPEGLYSCYYNFAVIYIKEGILQTASDFFAKALEAAAELDTKMYLEACINISKNYMSLKEDKRVLDIVSNLSSELEEVSFNSIIIELYQLASKANKNLKRYDAAAAYIDKITHLKKELGDEKGVFYSKIEAALIATDSGSFETAKESLAEALEYFERTDDFIGRTFCINKLGQLYYRLGEYDDALNYFKRTLDELTKSGFDVGLAVIKKRLGTAYFKKGDFKNAASFLNEAASEEEEAGSAELYKTYKMMGIIYKKQGNDKKAIEYFEKAYDYEASKNIGDKEKSAYTLGLLYAKARKSGLAIKYFEKCASAKNAHTAPNSLRQLLFLYKDIGEVDKLKGVLRRLLHVEEDENALVLLKKSLEAL